MKRDEILAELIRLQDKDYAVMQAKIIPTVAANRIIGVRTPALRTFAKSLYRKNVRMASRLSDSFLIPGSRIEHQK